MVQPIETKYVFTIIARIAEVTTAGDIGHGVRRIIPIVGGEVKEGDAVHPLQFGPFGVEQDVHRQVAGPVPGHAWERGTLGLIGHQ